MRIKIKVFSPANKSKIKKKSGNFYLACLKGKREVNQELVELLAKYFRLSPENIKLISSSDNNMRYVEITDKSTKLQLNS